MHITITGELTDLNTYVAALNTNRYAGSKIKREETQRVAWEAKKTRQAKPDRFPVFITYEWYSKNARKDIDNVAFSKKQINDGLVKAGILPDDSRKYIKGFSDFFAIDKENPRVEVWITPL